MKKVRVYAIWLLLAISIAFTTVTVGILRRSPSKAAYAETAAIYYLGDDSVTEAEGYKMFPATVASPVIYRYKNHAKGWSAAYVASAALKANKADNCVVSVVLASDWVAAVSGSTTYFGSGTGFLNNALSLNDGVEISLDLNGKKLNRNLAAATNSGYVLRVYTGAQLEITDSSDTKNGEITGGYNTTSGGGIYNDGKLTLTAGKITANRIGGNPKATGNICGAGVINNNEFYMNGGEIVDNTIMSTITNSYASGVYSGKTFVMTGGVIAQNKNYAVGNNFGAGVGAWSGTFTMSGGEIKENESKPTLVDNSYVFGAAIATYAGTITLKGDAKVIDNKGYNFANKGSVQGAGIGIYSAGKLNIQERALISGNVAYTRQTGTVTDTIGGGVCALHEGAVINMSGGTITNNYAEQGGGINTNGVLNMSGGTISGNRSSWIGGVCFNAYSSVYSSDIKVLQTGTDGKTVSVVDPAKVDRYKGVVNLSGNPVIKDNVAYTKDYAYGVATKDADNRDAFESNLYIRTGGLQNTTLPNYFLNVGKLTEGADIHIITGGDNKSDAGGVGKVNAGKSENEAFALNYLYGKNKAKNNVTEFTFGDYTYAKPSADPSQYFKSDRGLKIALDPANGNLYESKHSFEFAAKQVAGVEEELDPVSLYCYETTFEPDKKVRASIKQVDGAEAVKTDLTFTVADKDGNAVNADNISHAGVYFVTATCNCNASDTNKPVVAAKFIIAIKQRAITQSDVTLSDAKQEYTNSPKTPHVSVAVNGLTLVKDTDFAVVYENNVQAGRNATAKVSGTGNYTGEIVLPFIIYSSGTAYEAVWQYKNSGDEWITIPEDKRLFTYSEGVNYDDRIRLALTVPGTKVNDFAFGGSAASESNTELKLVFSGTFAGAAVSTLENATTYTVRAEGSSNYKLPDHVNFNKEIQITILPKLLDYTEADFVDYNGTIADEAKGENRLWIIEDLGAGLQDRVTYADPDAPFNDLYGAKVIEGTLYNAYVRYNGLERTIILNPNYKVKDTTIALLDATADFEYVNDSNVAVGAENVVTRKTAIVRITFNDNYKVSAGGDNHIELRKEWLLVTINNNLHALDGGDANKIESWTYGEDVSDRLPFRAEHGNAVIYSVLQGDEVKARFAAKFTEVLAGADVQISYYYVTLDEDGALAVDYDNKITDDNYFAQTLQRLSAGNYTLNAYAPRFQPNGIHNHWWIEGSGSATENVVYYPVSVNFDFTVAKYALTADNTGTGEKAIKVTIIESIVSYNGQANNLPVISVSFGGVALVEGVDYSVTSENVDVGKASFVISGLKDFEGDVAFAESYTIAQAKNGWQATPTVENWWAYGSYKKDVNRITAKSVYLNNAEELWFKITTDAAGNTVAAEALGEFRVTDGVVSDEVAQAIAKLKAGDYYLFATVNGNANYEQLSLSEGVHFKVFLASNGWLVAPSVIGWNYDGFSAAINRVIATAKLGNDTIKLSIADSADKVIIADLKVVDGKVADSAQANILKALNVGTYFLVYSIAQTEDYEGIAQGSVQFNVSKSNLLWGHGENDLVLPTWIVGEYNEEVNKIIINSNSSKPEGKVNILITDVFDTTKIYYRHLADSDKPDINILSECKVGKYQVTAWVEESGNYVKLAERTFFIEILPAKGLPWWVTLCVTSGTLLVIAAILFILWKKGVFSFLTDKIIIAIRTKASVDATIASIRAAKRMEEGRKSVEEAIQREQEEQQKK